MECWIPPEVPYDSSRSWAEYEETLYRIFREDFFSGVLSYLERPVKVRRLPMYDGKEESFWHLTCRDYKNGEIGPEGRDPELARCRKIRWPRAIVERHPECPVDGELCRDCGMVTIWRTSHPTRRGAPRARIKMLFEDDPYLVVLEEREAYYLLITGYPVEDRSLGRIRREIEKAQKKQEARIRRF